ncbi:DUF5018 domain-containing protein [Chitinophaga sp. S165]|uniref:DUF5018 domain-containing protein n=1 Tax=Chitinophaga sp. S165 TaxID=2135462 RepID=UPI000D717D52|nr:DUF5018 domain-containing protein [Chitinophaga sp. S165]PWV47683.1 uncharacterized protein DUF5018 [Chitinophaga sp. S165]
MKLSAFLKQCIVPLLLVMSVVACKKDNDGVNTGGSSEKKILTFKVGDVNGIIDEATHTININVPTSYSLSAVPVSITISPKATASLGLNMTLDLTKAVTCTITAEDKSTVTYTVTGKIGLNDQNSITSFKLMTIDDKNPLAEMTIDSANNRIFLDMFVDASFITTMKTDIELPYGATSVPGPKDTVDFTNPVHYIVKAENGSIREYDVIVRNTRNNLDSLFLPVHGLEYGKYLEPYALYQSGMLQRFIPQDFYGNLAGGAYALFYALESDDLFLQKPYKAVISTNATATPSFDMLADYGKDVVYKITSQSGADRNYTVRVIKNKVIFKNMAFYQGYYTFSSFNSMFGLDYRSDARITQIWAVDTLTSAITPMKIEKGRDRDDWGIYHDYFGLIDGTPLAKGTYRLKVKLENGEEDVTRMIFKGEPPIE